MPLTFLLKLGTAFLVVFIFYLPVIHSPVKRKSSKLGIRLSNKNKHAFSNGKNDLIQEQKLAEKQV